MQAFRALLGLSFKSLLLTTLNTGRGKKKKRKAASGIGALILLSVLMVYLSGVYSFMLASAFAPIGGLGLMMQLMCVMATAFPFIFIVFAAQSLVFSTKDVDMVLSLPVSSFSVMLARVLALYLEALLMVELMLIPAGAAYLIHGGAGGVGFFLMLLVEGAFLALVPTTLALIFGFIIAFVVARLPFKNLLTVLFSLLLMVGVMVLSFSLSFTSSSLAEGDMQIDIAALSDMVTAIFAPATWAANGAMGQPLYALLLAAVCTLPFLGLTWVFSRFYKGILTRLASQRVRSDYKLRSVKSSSAFGALLKKESRKFFGSPAFLLNAGMGIVIAIIGCVAAVIYRGTIHEFLAVLAANGAGSLLRHLAPIALAAVTFFGSLTFVSCVSVSLEGKTLWILKAAPLSTGRIFLAKAGFNFILSAIASVVCIPLLGYALALPVGEVLAMLVLSGLFGMLTAAAGLQVNLIFPRMDAENDTIVIKQSASVIVTMLLDMLLLAAFVGLYIWLSSAGLSFMLYALVASGVLLLLNAGCILMLNTLGRKQFAAL